MDSLDIRSARRLALARAGLLKPSWTGFPGRAFGSGLRARRACHQVIARFDDGNAAIVLAHTGNGAIYYLAAPLKTADYHKLLSPLVQKLGLKRPVTGIDQNGQLVTGVEVRAVERENHYLVYASNLTPETVEFDLKGSGELGTIIDLRSLHEVPDRHIKLDPFQETIFKAEKNDYFSHWSR